MNFSISKIRIEISYLFLSLIIIYIAIDRTGYIIPLLISVFIHETAHIVCLLAFSCKIKSIKLLLCTVGVEYSCAPTGVARFMSLLCGPFSNLVISLISLSLKRDVFFGINFLLFVYNLLPIEGLDGGEIFEMVLQKFLSHTKIIVIMDLLTLCVTIIFCVSFFAITNNFSFIILCFYILSGLVFKKTLKDKHI